MTGCAIEKCPGNFRPLFPKNRTPNYFKAAKVELENHSPDFRAKPVAWRAIPSRRPPQEMVKDNVLARDFVVRKYEAGVCGFWVDS